MASLHKVKYKTGTGYVIRYRLHGKNCSEYLPISTGYLQAKRILNEFQQRLIAYKIEGKPFQSPLRSPDTHSLVEFKEWFLENKKIAIRRGQPVDPWTKRVYDYAFKRLLESTGNARLSDLPRRLHDIETMFNRFSPNNQSIIIRSLCAT